MENSTKKAKKKKIEFNVISPDGFTIERDKSYKSREEAEAAFDIWKKRFEHQGYYSSNRGRIALDELFDHCQITEA